MEDHPTIFFVGAALFGFLVGWVTYRTLRRRTDAALLSDIATVIGAVGGGAVLGIFKDEKSFGWYGVGLFAGFFLYLLVGFSLDKEGTKTWMGGHEDDTPLGGGGGGGIDPLPPR